MLTSEKKYKKRKTKYNELLQKHIKYSNIISLFRLLVFIIGLIVTILFLVTKYYYLCISSILVAIILFSVLVHVHNKLSFYDKYVNSLIEINNSSLMRSNGEWNSFPDYGEEFIDQNHNYSYDLDIFGKNSLFQWINTGKTYLGRLKLKKCLTENNISEDNVFSRQKAITELAIKLAFRQRLISESTASSNISENPEGLIDWSKNKNSFKLPTLLKIVIIALPIITIFSIIIALSSTYIPYYIPTAFLILQLIILKINSDSRSAVFAMAEKYNKNIKAYEGMLKLIEKQKFKSDYLKDLHKKLFNLNHISASTQIKQLSNISETISSRHNMAYAVLNLLFFIDYHMLTALQTWQLKYGEHLSDWIDVIGEFECLSSLSIIKHDNPEWTMPKIECGAPHFSSKGIGHPLLGSKRICNDVILNEPKTVLLITGSNMSGKSTLLRTIGINLVLAYAGAPVCASSFKCSIMSLYSCMRINDNLEKSISSFYAEILKIKNIVKASDDGEKVFFLLDEIFKGTNSLDRHTGASVLIKQLSNNGNLGLVSTHDFELADLEKESNSKIANYHFEEYYKDDKIHFDYKLKSGISCTRNAVYLMKLAGIDMDKI